MPRNDANAATPETRRQRVCYTPGVPPEALYYEKLEDDKVRCRLCPQDCLIRPGRVGVCFIRQNIDGRLVPLTYARVGSSALDPIEKKPLYHFFPGSTIYSISGIGCSLGCPFCQNWSIAHPKDRFMKRDPRDIVEAMTQTMAPDEVVARAASCRPQGNIGVAFTYNEPLIWFEFVLETAKLLREAELKTVLVTNGFINPGPLDELLPFVDAMNIDVKGFSEEFYHRLGGSLEPVLRAAEKAAAHCHVEITNLLVPGWNTDEAHVTGLVDWIADALGPDTPLHLSRYFPARKVSLPPTSLSALERAAEIAGRKLNHVHLGNV